MELIAVTFFPAVGALLLLLLPSKQHDTIKLFSLLFAVITFLLSVFLYAGFDPVAHPMQFQIKADWITSFGISFYMGIDGISLLLIVMTTLLMILAILCSWNAITTNVKGYYVSMLLLATGMIGVFCSLDLFLFYVFWELMLVPMYFIIGLWGGPRRIYAAIKFVLFTMFGSLLMLVAILYLVFEYKNTMGAYSFNIIELMKLQIAPNVQMWLFAAFALAFAIKVPLFPLHTWLPDAHVEAPTAGSVILAGVLLKLGTYGFVRICLPIFPDATLAFTPYISVLAVIAIIYGALVAMVQKDVKSLVAFSSVSHMGFIMLGLFALNMQALQGSVLQMINHGISTGALFLIVGMIYERRHTRMIADFGGLAKVMPVFSTIFLIVTLSSIGLPLTNGFVGEFLILLGVFKANITYAVLAATGVVLSACYMLWMFQRVIFGKITNPENEKLLDLSMREKLILAPLIALIFWIGIYPKPLFDIIEPSIREVQKSVEMARIRQQNEVQYSESFQLTEKELQKLSTETREE